MVRRVPVPVPIPTCVPGAGIRGWIGCGCAVFVVIGAGRAYASSLQARGHLSILVLDGKGNVLREGTRGGGGGGEEEDGGGSDGALWFGLGLPMDADGTAECHLSLFAEKWDHVILCKSRPGNSIALLIVFFRTFLALPPAFRLLRVSGLC